MDHPCKRKTILPVPFGELKFHKLLIDSSRHPCRGLSCTAPAIADSPPKNHIGEIKARGAFVSTSPFSRDVSSELVTRGGEIFLRNSVDFLWNGLSGA